MKKQINSGEAFINLILVKARVDGGGWPYGLAHTTRFPISHFGPQINRILRSDFYKKGLISRL